MYFEDFSNEMVRIQAYHREEDCSQPKQLWQRATTKHIRDNCAPTQDGLFAMQDETDTSFVLMEEVRSLEEKLAPHWRMDGYMRTPDTIEIGDFFGSSGQADACYQMRPAKISAADFASTNITLGQCIDKLKLMEHRHVDNSRKCNCESSL